MDENSWKTLVQNSDKGIKFFLESIEYADIIEFGKRSVRNTELKKDYEYCVVTLKDRVRVSFITKEKSYEKSNV